MMNNQTFSFTTQNPKASRYLLICLISFMLIFCISFLNPVILIILIFGCMALGFILFARHSKISEEITLYDAYFHSRVFGPIYYDDIVSAKPVTVDTGEGLKLKLTNGKKVWWKYLITAEKEEYESFLAALSTAVDHLNLSQNKDALSESKPEVEASRILIAAQESEPVETGASLGQELKNVQKKNKNSGNARTFLLVLSGVVLALYGLVRTCGSEWVHERNEKERTPIRQAISGHLDEVKSLKDSAHDVVNRYFASHGPYYLLSNDTSAKLKYIPQPDGAPGLANPPGQSRIKLVFDDGRQSDYYKKIIRHPDSLNWYICLQTANKPYLLKKHYFDSDESINTYLYVAVINLSKYIAVPSSSNAYGGTQQTDSARIEIEKAIPLNADLSLEANIEKGLRMFRPIIKKYPDSSKFYLAARDGEGRMDKKLFEKAAVVFKKQMANIQVDTAKFEMKEF